MLYAHSFRVPQADPLRTFLLATVVCIFIFGSRFFDRVEDISLLRHANKHGVKCIPVAAPGATFLPGGYKDDAVEESRLSRLTRSATGLTTQSSNAVVAKMYVSQG